MWNSSGVHTSTRKQMGAEKKERHKDEVLSSCYTRARVERSRMFLEPASEAVWMPIKLEDGSSFTH